MTSHPEFGAYTDASAVASAFASSIKDKVVLITGVSTGGIGGVTAIALAAHSPRLLILAGRSTSRVNPVIDSITKAYPAVPCRFLGLDLASQDSVRSAAAVVLGYQEPLHILINNAAVMALPEHTLTTNGIEMQFATNHIGPFLLTNLLIPKMLSSSSPAPRIINLTSTAHVLSPIRFSDLTFSKPNASIPEEEQYSVKTMQHLGLLPAEHRNDAKPAYVPMVAYGHSKTANILFSIALNARFASSDQGARIRIFAVHPGSINTDIQRHVGEEALKEARKRARGIVRTVEKSLEQGASTTLVAALDPALEAGEAERVYMADCGFEEPAAWCVGEKGKSDAERLWAVSEDLVGEKFVW